MQQLANDLTLVFLLYPAQDGGVGRGRGDSETDFQVLSRFDSGGGTIGEPEEFRCQLEKITSRGPALSPAPR